MQWSKRVSPKLVACLSCGIDISRKPKDECTAAKHQEYYQKRRTRNNEYRREKRQANPYFANFTPAQRRAYDKRKYRRQRQELILRLCGLCTRCGLDDIRCLQIDHRNGGGHKERKEYGWEYFKFLYRLSDEELGARYQILCANCHAIKTYEHYTSETPTSAHQRISPKES